MQLVVRDGLSKSGLLFKVITKASKVVSFVRKSTHATDLMEGEWILQTAFATRWNSPLTTIHCILTMSSEKLDKLDCVKLSFYERET